MPPPIVLKFGGTSVADADAFVRAAEIVARHGGPRPVVVVSAMSGMTDALVAAVRTGTPALDDHFERHRTVARRLLSRTHAETFETDLSSARQALAALLGRGESDGVLALGEQLSSALLTAVLAARGLPTRLVDARHCIVTDGTAGRAAPLFPDTDERTREALEPLLEGGAIPVLGGFIGATRAGTTTTLGRGGSDYSAALVGAALDAAEIQIWTDVHGVMTADPRIVKGAHTIPRLSYAEAAELAYFGAKVLHPRTMQPALDRRIPIRIGNSRAEAGPATLVTAEADVWPDAIKAIAHKTGITIVQVTSARMFGAYGFLRALFEVFDRHRTSIDVVSTSEVSVSLSLDDTAALGSIVAELRRFGTVEVEPGRAIICVVGEGLRRTPGVAARVFETIQDINVLLISQGASQVNLTFVVDEARAADAVVRLHDAVLEAEGPPEPVVAGGTGLASDVCALARRLIDIPSVSGDEAAIAAFVANLLRDLGYRVDLVDAVPGRPNLVATTVAPPRVVLCTHFDTVPPFIGSQEEEGGEFIAGRGACDAKGILAAQIAAAERLRSEGVTELGLLFVVDEEMGSLGARAANAHPRARDSRYLVVGEPTDNLLAVGCKGSLRVALKTTGTGGHSAYPERGSSANDRLLDVLADLRAADWPADAFFGETTCNIGILAGGTRTNVLATEARADLHVRLVTEAERVQSLLERIVAGRAEIEYLSVTPPVRLTGLPGFEDCVVGFTTDTAHLDRWGTPLVLGPGSIHEAHTAHERIAKTELVRGVELYTRLVRSLLANSTGEWAGAAAGEGARQ